LGKPLRIVYAVMALVLALSTLYSIYVNHEKQKLNQRYERTIEQWELNVRDLSEINKGARELTDRLKSLADHLQ
jgi:hypothetical protein